MFSALGVLCNLPVLAAAAAAEEFVAVTAAGVRSRGIVVSERSSSDGCDDSKAADNDDEPMEESTGISIRLLLPNIKELLDILRAAVGMVS